MCDKEAVLFCLWIHLSLHLVCRQMMRRHLLSSLSPKTSWDWTTRSSVSLASGFLPTFPLRCVPCNLCMIMKSLSHCFYPSLTLFLPFFSFSLLPSFFHFPPFFLIPSFPPLFFLSPSFSAFKLISFSFLSFPPSLSPPHPLSYNSL